MSLPTGAEQGGGRAVPGDQPRYTVAAVARRLGVAPATLRTWDRRYGLGPSEHASGQHRRYSAADVERLTAMRRLTLDGVPPGEAARLALAGGVQHRVAEQPSIAPAVGHGQRARPSGGRVLSMPGVEPGVRGLARAAMALDAPAATAQIRRTLGERGVAAAWHDLVVPVLTAIGDRWEVTGDGVDVEHLLSECTLAALRPYITEHAPAGTPRVLLACAPEDYHGLPLHVLGAALAERGIGVRNLGGAVPEAALDAAVRRTGPAVVFVWSSLRRTGDPAHLGAVPVTAPAAAVVVGGPGWWLESLPERAVFAGDVASAVERIVQRLGL